MPATANRSTKGKPNRRSRRKPAATGLAAAAAVEPINEAAAYDVLLVQAIVAPEVDYWAVERVRHLSPEENQGKHNVFVDAVDENDQRVRDPALRIGWTWEGRRPDEHADPKPLDKPDNEPAGNVDINNTGTHLDVWLEGDGLASDRVANLHTNHPDEPASDGQLWNSIGHHSFYVRFKRTRKQEGDAGNGDGGEEGSEPVETFRFEAWPTERRLITQPFGARPEYYAQWQLPGHEGIDIAADPGTQIFCVAAGEVYAVHGQDDGHVYGIHVRVEHRDGYRTVYAHLQEARVVEGQQVESGQLLGLAGMTGNTDGPHLHLTLKRDGRPDPGYPNDIVDPTPFLMPLLGEAWLDARYVRDTVADLTIFRPGEQFIQTWTLQNNGTQPWDAGFRLVCVGVDALGAPDGVDLPPALPGATVDLSVTFEAPWVPGSYRSVWQACDVAGTPFGDPIWTAIVVATDFVFMPLVAAAPESAIAPLLSQVRVFEKLGVDANAPIDLETGMIAPQVADPAIIGDTGAGWVRLNFVLGRQWATPEDPARPQGFTWEATYRRILDGLRGRKLRVFALIGHEAVREDPGDRFRDTPSLNALDDSWVQSYAANVLAITRMFRNELDVIETFNEPDDWRGQNRNWIHPGWMAVLQEAVYRALRGDPSLAHLRIVSGPLQGLQGPHKGNGAAGYLDRMYQHGIGIYGWGRDGHPFPFDGVGYHLYIHEEVHEDRARQEAELRTTFTAYLEQMRAVVRQHEGGEKPFYISECGWFSNSDNRERGEAFQAISMALGLNMLLQDPAVALVIHFCTQDFGQLQDGKWYGLYRQGSLSVENRKPAHAAFCVVSAQPHLVPTPAPIGPVDGATYVEGKDAVADETLFAPGQPFQQVWFLRNSGATAWAAGYTMAQVGGDPLGAPERVSLPACAPGEEVPVLVPFTAPVLPGRYLSLWQPCNPAGVPFGQRVWTIINVAAVTPAGAPAALVVATAVEVAPSLQESLRFLVRLGVIYERALEEVPAAGGAEEVRGVVMKARRQLEDFLARFED